MTVAAALAYDAESWEQDCRLCRRPGNEHLRAQWGCDADVEGREFDCHECMPRNPDPACTICHGTGTWQLTRCPHVFIGPDHRLACSAASMIEVGILPARGGWIDQTLVWQQAAHLALRERAGYEERRRRRS